MSETPNLTLVGSLSRPMVPMEDAPTVTMPAVGDDPSVLPWEAVTYRLRYGVGQAFASAHVMRLEGHPEAPEGREWIAMCAGPGESSFADSWHATGEAARAAVEEHIAANVEQALAAGEPR